MASASPAAVHHAATARFAARGQLYTAGRRELVDMLAELGRPVTAYELLASRPKLTQSSVYRNLAVLEEMGVVQRVAAGDDRVRFELAEEIIGHHHHLVCDSCGRIEDFEFPKQDELALDELLAQSVAPSGFAASSHRLDVIGRCATCAVS